VRGEIAPNLLNWILGVALVYATLFGIGDVIFGAWARAALFIVIAALSAIVLIWNLNRTRWAGIAEVAEVKATGD
jgi:hypothetical protein